LRRSRSECFVKQFYIRPLTHFKCRSFHTTDAKLGSQSRPITVKSTVIVTTRPTDTMATHMCGGIELPMPSGLSPYQAYPFGLHDLFILPWGVHIMQNKLRIQSIHCTRRIQVTGQTAVKAARSCLLTISWKVSLKELSTAFMRTAFWHISPSGGLISLTFNILATCNTNADIGRSQEILDGFGRHKGREGQHFDSGWPATKGRNSWPPSDS